MQMVAITILILLGAAITYARVQERLIERYEKDDCR